MADTTNTPDRATLQANHDALIQRMSTNGWTNEDLRTSEQQIAELAKLDQNEGGA